MKINTPHIPLNVDLSEGIKILSSVSKMIETDIENEDTFYKVSMPEYECGFFEKNNTIVATWYNDPLGRGSNERVSSKVELYLERYASLESWDKGVNNGWIQFFNNSSNKISMAYGLHNDVLRFNYHD